MTFPPNPLLPFTPEAWAWLQSRVLPQLTPSQPSRMVALSQGDPGRATEIWGDRPPEVLQGDAAFGMPSNPVGKLFQAETRPLVAGTKTLYEDLLRQLHTLYSKNRSSYESLGTAAQATSPWLEASAMRQIGNEIDETTARGVRQAMDLVDKNLLDRFSVLKTLLASRRIHAKAGLDTVVNPRIIKTPEGRVFIHPDIPNQGGL